MEDESNEQLISAIVLGENGEEYIESTKVILESRGIKVANFNTQTYIDCVIAKFPDGWEIGLREMFAALIAIGWTRNNGLIYNFAWGSINIEGCYDDENGNLDKVVEAYLEILENTCCQCGSQTEVERFEDDSLSYLCSKCLQEILEQNTITEISQVGFKYYYRSHRSGKGCFKYVKWNEIKDIKINNINYYDEIELTLDKLTKEELIEANYEVCDEYHIYFNNKRHINFFALLKQIPKNNVTEQVAEEIRTIFSCLTQCEVCGYKAVYINCFICHCTARHIRQPEHSTQQEIDKAAKIMANNKRYFEEHKKNSFVVI